MNSVALLHISVLKILTAAAAFGCIAYWYEQDQCARGPLKGAEELTACVVGYVYTTFALAW